jgi:tRNA threonylcarbamoyladenosine biosynthesis protein TsaE
VEEPLDLGGAEHAQAAPRALPRPEVAGRVGDGTDRGLTARGLDVPGSYYVTSPSFTLINEYPGRLPLFHIDLYRLEADLDLDDLGLTDALKGDGVAAVEWADKLPPGALSGSLEIRFETGEGDRRTLRFSGCGQDASSLLKSLSLIVGGSGILAPP